MNVTEAGFPYLKHATKQDKHAQLTSKGDVGVFLLFKCVLAKLTSKKTNYSRNLTKSSSLVSLFCLPTNNTKMLKIHYMPDFTTDSTFLCRIR